jgi:hypothetical protein
VEAEGQRPGAAAAEENEEGDCRLRRVVCIQQARRINKEEMERLKWMGKRSEWSCCVLSRSGLPAVA